VTRRWAVRLTPAAEADFRGILRWTIERFGQVQARIYADVVSSTLEDLADGPSIIGVKGRDDIAKGLFTLHVARKGHKGRHFDLFRINKDQGRNAIEVLRLLHDAMDLPHHLSEKENPE
jgi:toxin ParE1/3/4